MYRIIVGVGDRVVNSRSDDFSSTVREIVIHLPGPERTRAPIVAAMAAVEIVTDHGSRWYGEIPAIAERALDIMREGGADASDALAAARFEEAHNPARQVNRLFDCGDDTADLAE